MWIRLDHRSTAAQLEFVPTSNSKSFRQFWYRGKGIRHGTAAEATVARQSNKRLSRKGLLLDAKDATYAPVRTLRSPASFIRTLREELCNTVHV